MYDELFVNGKTQTNMKCRVILCFIIVLLTFFYVDAKANRKIILTWEDIVSCPGFENKETDLSRAEIYMINETAIGLKGEIDIKANFETPPVAVKAIVEKEVSPGNYMTMLTFDLPDLCEKVKDPDDMWGQYFKQLKPQPTDCTSIKNTYNVDDVTPQQVDVQLKKELIGTYKSKIQMFRSDTAKEGLPGAPTMWSCYTLNFKIDSVS